jgi:hypothetical protein
LITGSALLAHPLIECSQQNRILLYWLSTGGCYYAGTSKVPQEQAHTIKNLKPVRMTITRALASAQMSAEKIMKLLVQTGDLYAFSALPIHKVFRRSDVSAGGYLCVARIE